MTKAKLYPYWCPERDPCHRSHFGSRYTLGCLLPGLNSCRCLECTLCPLICLLAFFACVVVEVVVEEVVVVVLDVVVVVVVVVGSIVVVASKQARKQTSTNRHRGKQACKQALHFNLKRQSL